MNDTALRSCTVESRSHRFCGRTSAPDMPFPICSQHARLLYREMASLLDANASNPFALITAGFHELDQRRAQRIKRALPRPEDIDPVVYYVLIDGLVKIGYASNLAKRLTGYPPTAQVLATEPGDREAESARHAEFAEYLTAGREWFTPGPRLRDHIEGLPDYRAA